VQRSRGAIVAGCHYLSKLNVRLTTHLLAQTFITLVGLIAQAFHGHSIDLRCCQSSRLRFSCSLCRRER
jgi:hypothetical protein